MDSSKTPAFTLTRAKEMKSNVAGEYEENLGLGGGLDLTEVSSELKLQSSQLVQAGEHFF